MLPEEATWFAGRLAELDPDRLFPLLNVGSSTGEFREVHQPWIDAQIFLPLRQAHGTIIHLDLQDAPGVDFVGDLREVEVQRRLSDLGVRSVFCSNLLEHVQDRAQMFQAIAELVPPGGYVCASCPRRYPRHDDPIDTMYRPATDELAAAFPGTRVLASAEVRGGTYFDYLGRSPLRVARTVARAWLPMYSPATWRSTLRHLRWLPRHFVASCVVLERI